MSKQHTLLVVSLFSLACLGIAPFLGMNNGLSADMYQHILQEIRLPRVLFAFVAGAGLALCGMVFQAMFQNPLATPFTLGVASGASLGAASYIFFGLSFSFFGIDGASFTAFAGALIAISIVYGISHFRQGFSVETLLLTGVAISFFFSSLILFVQYLSNITDSFRIIRWLMGELSSVSYKEILQLAPFVGLSLLLITWWSRELNLLMAGDDIALSRGVAVKQIRYRLFIITSLCVGGIVAITGPIGFIGMMVPHMCRLLIGTDHRWLIPASFMFGGAFLVICDTLARLLLAPSEIPVGVITTLLGGPFFIWLLVRSKTKNY
jgi:iron complex transport system permease protein